ncbi:MAG: hypothetical protein F6J93_17450 [Oscillatoria sp. SIO1A7]|nr:hypothetical protein [Oscillatoria sp. SIO1A7]
MVLPVILGAAAVGAGAFGLKQGLDANSSNSSAKKIQGEAQAALETAERELQNARQTTGATLEKLGQLKLRVWHSHLGRFVTLYSKLKGVELSGGAGLGSKDPLEFGSNDLLEMKDLSLKAGEVIVGGAGAAGAGALAGMASYGGAMMFGTASTGTAIGSLTGAAATNATLAWFGGGSLAAGGLGMAGGMAVLGGIVAGPVLAVGGIAMAAKAQKNLAEALSYEAEVEKTVEEMEKAIAVLRAIDKTAALFDKVIRRLSESMASVLNELEDIIISAGNNYDAYNSSQKSVVYLSVQFAGVLKQLLETPILTPEGALDKTCTNTLQQGVFLLEPA